MPKKYITVKSKFVWTLIITGLWLLVCTYIETWWYQSLTAALGPILAHIVIITLAALPGIMLCQLICGIIFDKPRRREIKRDELPPLTILVAAYNEEAAIYETLQSIANQDYPNHLIVKVIDNNSIDNTKAEILRAQQDFQNIEIQYELETKQGKYAALNHGLAEVETKYVLTIDADTFVFRDAIIRLANAIVQESKNKNVGAVAGAVLVRNSRINLLTKLQEWDYFMCIAGIKRAQGLFQSTLVAQGAFSIYNTEKVKSIGGWSSTIGEDITVTWRLLNDGAAAYYEDQALAFTNVPTKYKAFFIQRSRWAKGMVQSFKTFKPWHCPNKYAAFLIFCDYFLFAIDFGVAFIYIPGLIAALFFQNYLIVGPTTLMLLPLSILFFAIMLISEYRRVFKPLGLKIRRHWGAFAIFVLTYSLILSPACIYGYGQEMIHVKDKWR